MADKKISALTAGSALGGAEKIPMVQSSSTVYTTPADIGGFSAEYGLTLSNSTGKVLAVAAGRCADSTRAVMISLSSFTGSLAGTFTAGTGNNKLDTGTVANSTTYHVYAIAKTDGTADILFSTSASSPTMPSGYTYKRRIGSLRTDGSGDWVLFTQYGNEFLLSTPVLDQTWTNATSAALQTMTSIPSGVKLGALINAACATTGANNLVLYISSPDQTDLAPSAYNSTTDAERASLVSPAAFGVVGSTPLHIQIRTNTSAQIRIRASAAAGTTLLASRGWVDHGIVGLGI